MSKKRSKPVRCNAGELPPTTFPERSALSLGPGESYIEAFDPRLLCFGNDAKALVGGAVVRARFGWEVPPRGGKDSEPPFAVEDSSFPPTRQAMKVLAVPTIVLNHLPPDDGALSEAALARDERPPPLAVAPPPMGTPSSAASAPRFDGFGRHVTTKAPPPSGAVAPPLSSSPPPEPAPSPTDPEWLQSNPPASAPPEPPAVLDENAPVLEVSSTPFVDTVDGRRAAVTLTLKNVGRRATLVAFRPRMVRFRVDGPDGVVRCGDVHPPAPLDRRSFHSLRPGGELALPVILSEACGTALFLRSGLYRITATVTLSESGAAQGLVAYTGTAASQAPTLLRVQAGEEPFYRNRPEAVKTRVDDDAP